MSRVASTTIQLFSGGGLILLGFLVGPQADGQPRAAASPLAFEVASVKVAPSGPNGVRGGCHGIDSVYSPQQEAEAPPLGRCVITDARLSHLIGIAYGISMLNLKTGPDWIQRGDLRFNVEAKAEDSAKATEKQLLTMLQNLLADRFQLKFHYETAEATGLRNSMAVATPAPSKNTTITARLNGSSTNSPLSVSEVNKLFRVLTIPTLSACLD